MASRTKRGGPPFGKGKGKGREKGGEGRRRGRGRRREGLGFYIIDNPYGKREPPRFGREALPILSELPTQNIGL